MSQREIVSTPHAPKAIGPYSQAVKCGEWLHLSGQIGLDPSRGELVNGGVAEQTAQAMANLGAVLAAAGGAWSDVQKCNVYLVDMADFAAMNEVYARALGAGPYPARATVAVHQLPRGARVEIDCVAKLSRP